VLLSLGRDDDLDVSIESQEEPKEAVDGKTAEASSTAGTMRGMIEPMSILDPLCSVFGMSQLILKRSSPPLHRRGGGLNAGTSSHSGCIFHKPNGDSRAAAGWFCTRAIPLRAESRLSPGVFC
jgi:hypothetical protein